MEDEMTITGADKIEKRTRAKTTKRKTEDDVHILLYRTRGNFTITLSPFDTTNFNSRRGRSPNGDKLRKKRSGGISKYLVKFGLRPHVRKV